MYKEYCPEGSCVGFILMALLLVWALWSIIFKPFLEDLAKKWKEKRETKKARGPAVSKEIRLMRKGQCPVCKTTRFSRGPQGGMCENIACENGHRWNVCPTPFEVSPQEVIRCDRI